MPELKAITGHTGCGRVRDYLEKNDRALARDFFNLSWDSREELGKEPPPEFDWAAEMDATRHKMKHDRPINGVRARMWKHYILSPDPQDTIDLEQLRELAGSWAIRCFADYQVAIVYHDDNEARIPHAHIVVNVSNLETRRKLHTDDPKAFNRLLQDMAEERGLSFMRDEPPGEGTSPQRPRTLQAIHRNRAEENAIKVHGYSWVEDIRSRVSVAKAIAADEADFRAVCKTLGLEVADSASARRADWVFSLAEEPAKRVTGERLGAVFGKTALTAHFARKAEYRPDAVTAEAASAIAREAVEVNDLADLDRLASCMEACNRVNAHTLADLDRRIERLEARPLPEGARAQARQERSLRELRDARDYAREKRLLPAGDKAPRPRREPKPRQANAPMSRRELEQRRKLETQQQTRAAEARRREGGAR